MKVTAIIATTILAAISHAAAVPGADPHCRWVGQSCSKAKHDAEAHAAVVPDLAGLEARSCGAPGQPCDKLKRAAEAAAEVLATAEPQPEANNMLEARHCHWVGQSCSKARRSAEALAKAVATAYADAFPNLEALTEACTFGDVACEKIKRYAAADPHCRWVGQSCSREKRKALAEAAKALTTRHCRWVGQSCS